MSKIGQLWAGHIFGTNTGKIFAEFDNQEEGFTGTLRVRDDDLGVSTFRLTGKFDGTNIEFQGAPDTPTTEGTVSGEVTATGALVSDGSLRGKWASTLGTGGTFHLFPHDVAEKTPALTNLPERIHTSTKLLGAVGLSATDLSSVISFMRRDFSGGRVVVSYQERGNEVSRYADDFQQDAAQLGELRFLKLIVQEPEAYGVNRIVVIELNADGVNEVRVSGVQEAWVRGKAEAVASHLRRYERWLATSFHKFGVTIPMLIAFATVVLAPELTLSRRLAFVATMAFILWAFNKLHRKFIPKAEIILGPRRGGIVQNAWPQILSWIIAATAGLAAAVSYGMLSGQIPLWGP